MDAKQYADLDTLGRLKEVGKWQARRMSNRGIARIMGCSESQIRKVSALMDTTVSSAEDIQEIIQDFVQRTWDEYEKLGALEASLWEKLDWASEMIVQTDGLGSVVFERNAVTGAITRTPQMTPRKSSMIVPLHNQIQSISKQRAELLKLVGGKTDQTAQLQMAMHVQTIVLESLQGLDPTVYAPIYRRIQALADEKPAVLEGIDRRTSIPTYEMEA